MRQIKFRIWDILKKEFVYGLFIDELGDIYQFKYVGLSVTLIQEIPTPYISMQFTGLTDRNGKEIYEGDICKWFGHECINGIQARPERQFVVDWNFDKLFQLKNIIENNGTLEVVGNIYENSELL
jgi:uncharacterized phage protein (TIGR01671 family)